MAYADPLSREKSCVWWYPGEIRPLDSSRAGQGAYERYGEVANEVSRFREMRDVMPSHFQGKKIAYGVLRAEIRPDSLELGPAS